MDDGVELEPLNRAEHSVTLQQVDVDVCVRSGEAGYLVPAGAESSHKTRTDGAGGPGKKNAHLKQRM